MAGAGDATPEQRLEKLRGLLMGTRRDTRAARSLARYDKGNVLIGAALHAADRLREGKAPTDLERQLLAVMRAALPDAEIKGWGQVYREAVAKLGNLDVIPQTITSRPVSSGYSMADLVAGFGPVAQEAASMPNTAVVDPEVLATGKSIDSPEFNAGTREFGFGATAFSRSRQAISGQTAENEEATETADAAEDGERTAPSAFNVKLELESFYVHRAVGDQGGGRDEIYWCSASASDKAEGPAYKSQEFGAVKKGDRREFSASNRTVFNGKASTHVMLSVYCWEADQSSSAWYDELHKNLKTLSKTIFETWKWQLYTGVLPGTEVAGWAGEILKLGIFLMEHLRNYDDLSCARAIVLDQFDLALMSHRKTALWHFDGDGHHELTVRYSGDKVPFPEGTLEYVVYEGDNASAPITLPWKSMGAPALASFKGKLHALFLRASDQAVMWTVLDGQTWTPPVRVRTWRSYYPPAMAVYKDKLYCTIVATDGKMVWSVNTTGTSWAETTRSRNYNYAAAPALAAWRNQLWQVDVDLNQKIYENYYDGTDPLWSRSEQWHPWETKRPVGLTTQGNTLWQAVRGTGSREGRVDLTYCEFSGGWKDFATPSNWRVTSGPTLAAHNNRLWIFLRNTSGVLTSSTHSGSAWSDTQPVGFGGEIKPMDEANPAVHNGKLYVAYRRPAPA